ncbi:hypothetical protein LWE61_17685 [Sphingobium sufflavum]|uniref:hypothetical protein n=1 Tax=Sphingobium sufflavum TaxID=1129547 RepID=UPI001F44929E|nr:hypothetical protein [Sphingobium sufflavum]MCE7798372.1 hypothetical protein [Sphingobium sufflavum]
MSLRPSKVQAIRDIVRDRMVQSGVDNYIFSDGQLQIGSTRYAVEACGCGEADCDGLRLRPVHRHFQSQAAFSAGRIEGTA